MSGESMTRSIFHGISSCSTYTQTHIMCLYLEEGFPFE